MHKTQTGAEGVGETRGCKRGGTYGAAAVNTTQDGSCSERGRVAGDCDQWAGAAARELDKCRRARAAPEGLGYDDSRLIARRRGEQAAEALVLCRGFRQWHELQVPAETACEANREPDRLVSRNGVESAYDGPLGADEVVPVRDHLGVARGVGQLGRQNHAGIVREYLPRGHGAGYAIAEETSTLRWEVAWVRLVI